MEVRGLTLASRGSCWLPLLRSPRTCCSPGFQTGLPAQPACGLPSQRRACGEQTPVAGDTVPSAFQGAPPCLPVPPPTLSHHGAASLLLPPPRPVSPCFLPPWCHPQAISFYQNNSC